MKKAERAKLKTQYYSIEHNSIIDISGILAESVLQELRHLVREGLARAQVEPTGMLVLLLVIGGADQLLDERVLGLGLLKLFIDQLRGEADLLVAEVVEDV